MMHGQKTSNYALMYCVCYLCYMLTNIAVGRQFLVKTSYAVF